MIYNNIEDIPYPFLHDACLTMDKYTKGFNRIRVDNKGECYIVLEGIIKNDTTLQRIMMELDPSVNSNSKLSDYTPEICEDFYYDYDNNQTHIYTKDNIDYRKI